VKEGKGPTRRVSSRLKGFTRRQLLNWQLATGGARDGLARALAAVGVRNSNASRVRDSAQPATCYVTLNEVQLIRRDLILLGDFLFPASHVWISHARALRRSNQCRRKSSPLNAPASGGVLLAARATSLFRLRPHCAATSKLRYSIYMYTFCTSSERVKQSLLASLASNSIASSRAARVAAR
jgi:hypothetical protein